MTTRIAIDFALGAMAAVVLGCGDQSSSANRAEGPTDAQVDGSVDTEADASAESDVVAEDAASNDSGVDVQRDVLSDGPVCPSIGAACADGGTLAGPCIESWSTAEQPSTWCPMFPYARVVRAIGCDGFDILVVGEVDTSTFYYYDIQSGDLVGIEGRGNGGASCAAGQSPDVPLTDCYEAGTAAVFMCQSDGSISD